MAVSVIYGSDGGATKAVATRIAKKIEGKAINITSATISDFEDCDLLILGLPTYGEGDLQCDWEENMATLKSANISNKKVALFGTGDQQNYPDSFVDAMGILYEQVVDKGAIVIGFTDTDGYSHTKSAAVRDGQFVGLALDEDNEPGKTGSRISTWISQLG